MFNSNDAIVKFGLLITAIKNTLTDLNLSGCDITAEQAVDIFTALEDATSLKTLNLSNNVDCYRVEL